MHKCVPNKFERARSHDLPQDEDRPSARYHNDGVSLSHFWRSNSQPAVRGSEVGPSAACAKQLSLYVVEMSYAILGWKIDRASSYKWILGGNVSIPVFVCLPEGIAVRKTAEGIRSYCVYMRQGDILVPARDNTEGCLSECEATCKPTSTSDAAIDGQPLSRFQRGSYNLADPRQPCDRRAQ